jgi:hypothetical protein
MLAGVAAFEREIILERQRAGIAALKAARRYKGRVPTALRQADNAEVLWSRSGAARLCCRNLPFRASASSLTAWVAYSGVAFGALVARDP